MACQGGGLHISGGGINVNAFLCVIQVTASRSGTGGRRRTVSTTPSATALLKWRRESSSACCALRQGSSCWSTVVYFPVPDLTHAMNGQEEQLRFSLRC